VGGDIRPYSRLLKSIKAIRHNKWNYLDFSYFRKWILVGFVLGIMAGLGSIGLYLGVIFFTSLFLVSGSGYVPPLPGSFYSGTAYTLIIEYPWMMYVYFAKIWRFSFIHLLSTIAL
jgi:chloride channel protein, CIC family